MKIVYVEWVDASSTEKYHKEAVSPKERGIGLEPCSSSGIVVRDTEEYLSLALTRAENGWYSDIISIPRVNIKLEKVLSNELGGRK